MRNKTMLLCGLFAISGTAGAGEIESLVGITNEIGTTSGLAVDIDLATGAGTALGTISRPGISLAFVPTLDRLYVALPIGGGQNRLTILDNRSYAESGSVGIITDSGDGSTHKVSAMGATPDGRLFGVSRRKGSIGGFNVPEGVLIEIDPNTAQATQIGAMGMPVRSRGGSIKDGSFYLITNPDKTDREQKLYRINLSNASTTEVGGTGVYGEAVGLTTDGDNQLLAVISGDTTPGLSSWNPESRLYEVSANTGHATLVGATGFNYMSSLTYLKFPVFCGLVTGADLSLAGSSEIDSWDSSNGPYTSGDADAVLCANAAAAIAAGGAVVNGDVFWGTDFSIAGSAIHNGTVEQLVEPTPIPDVNTAPAEASNDNASLPNGALDANGNLVLGGRDQVTLDAGTYFVHDLVLGNRAELTTNGPVEIWMDGTLTLGTNSVLNTGGIPTDLTIYSSGPSGTLNGTAYASFVMPYATLLLDGRGATYGYMLAHDITFQGQHDFHHDLAAAAQF
ncbi:MAG: hypothetical protein KC912_23945 [Proteobacteria bacterium]|nr:hypothetical protein [Pseudomonadota bacterium]